MRTLKPCSVGGGFCLGSLSGPWDRPWAPACPPLQEGLLQEEGSGVPGRVAGEPRDIREVQALGTPNVGEVGGGEM